MLNRSKCQKKNNTYIEYIEFFILTILVVRAYIIIILILPFITLYSSYNVLYETLSFGKLCIQEFVFIIIPEHAHVHVCTCVVGFPIHINTAHTQCGRGVVHSICSVAGGVVHSVCSVHVAGGVVHSICSVAGGSGPLDMQCGRGEWST